MGSKVLCNILSYSQEYLQSPLKAGDTLLSEILKTGIKYPIGDFYLQCGPPLKGNPLFLSNCSKVLSDECEKLAKYEYNLLRLIFNKDISFFFLVGPPGSGKSTTMNFLINSFVNSEERYHCTEDIGCKSDQKLKCFKNRICLNIDFDGTDWDTFDSSNEAREFLLSEINKRLQAQLFGWDKNSGPIRIGDDINFFWDWAIKEMNDRSTLNIRNALLKMKSLILDKSDKRDDAGFRKECRDHIFSNESDKLDYLLCLCHFLENVVYKCGKLCCFMYFDNIDYADMYIQKELFKIVMSRMIPYNFKVCIAARRETLDTHRVFTALKEYRIHEGPTALQLLLHRTIEFRKKFKSPELLISHCDEFETKEEAMMLLKHIDKLIGFLSQTDDKENVLSTFIDRNLRNFLRSMLKSSQYFFYNRKDFILQKTKSDHHFLRAFLRNDIDYYQQEKRSPICNLFYCLYDFTNYPILKIRILNYLNEIPALNKNKYGYLGDLYNHLRLFNYPERAIKEAINDLLVPSHQLLISDNRLKYKAITEDYFDDKVYITKPGEEYLAHAISSLDYLGEMIISCAIDEKYLKGINVSCFATERLHAVLRFLSNLGEIEFCEIETFINTANIDIYYRVYGNNSIIYKILLKVWDQLCRIASSSINTNRNLSVDFKEIVLDYKSIMTNMYNRNKELEVKFVNREKTDLKWRFNKIDREIDSFVLFLRKKESDQVEK